MKKSHKIIISVFSVLLAASIALVVLTMNGTLKRKPDAVGEVVNNTYSSADFAQLKSATVQTQQPIMKSDIDSVFYSVNTDGSIIFYEYKDGTLAEYNGAVKSITVTPELTYNKIPITISYIEKDGKTLGYGLFTNKNNTDVNLYSYVFAKLADAPTVYGLKGKMLLINTNQNEAFCNEKTYTDIFDFNIANNTLSRVFSQRDRQADKTGKFTDRWHILTDGFLKSVQNKAAVISGRLYNSDTTVYDIFDINRSINDPEATGIYGTFLRENSEHSGYIYLKTTSTGFKSVNFIAAEEEIARFEGNINSDFVFSGDWVYSVKDRTFTNLVNGTKITATDIEAIDMFAVNADGSKFVAVANYKDSQAFFVIGSDGSVKGYSGNNFFNSNINNICFAGNDAVLTTSLNDDGSCTNYITTIG